MPMPNYAIQGAPNMMNDPSAMDLAKNFAMQEGLNYGLDMMFPGAGVAKRGAQAIAPAFMNRGGPLYLQGGSYDAQTIADAGRYLWGSRAEEDIDSYSPGGGGWGSGTEADEWARGVLSSPFDASHFTDDQIGAVASEWVAEGSGTPGAWYRSARKLGYGPAEAKAIAKEKAAPSEGGSKKAAAPSAPLQKKAPAKKAAAKKAAPRPKPQAQAGIDWNVGLGNVGGWDLSTSGNYTLMDNAKDPYKVKLNAKRAFDTNRLFGAAPLGGPRERSKYADYQGGEYRERMPGERITTDIARGRKPATNPLQPYLDAGIDPEQAKMLMANKVPPPRPMNRGGPIYMNEGGKVPWWKSALAHAWQNDNMMKRAESQRRKTQDAQANKKALSEGDIGSFLGSAAKMFFNKGGGVSPSAGMEGPIAGMTPGPLGMSDLIAAGKDKDIAKVSYKKTGGKVAQQVDIAYHNPLQPKPSSSGE